MDRFKEREKANIRKEILSRLKSQEESERLAKSRSIEEKLFSIPEFIQARCVMFFVSFDGEVDTIVMIRHAQQMGKKVAVPVIYARSLAATKNLSKRTPKESCSGTRRMGGEKLIASLLKSSDNELIPGPYGILQPAESDILELSLDDIDLVIVPGVAFDRKGNRLGRGKGYYDRFLKDLTLKGIPSIGIAFDFQVVDNIPTLSHDLPVTKLITA